jgi:hypothetical protein
MAIPFTVAAGTFGKQILKHLYTGKKWVGTQSVKAADFAGKKGYAKTSKVITGVSQKGNQGIKYGVAQAKKYPRTASAIAGAATIKFLDD